MKVRLDLVGQRFGKLVVTEDVGQNDKHGNSMFTCKCDCGKEVEVRSKSLIKGDTKSCGCLFKEVSKSTATKRGNVTKEKYCVENTCLQILNQKLSKANTSGTKGVCWNHRKSKWQAQIQFRKINYHLGLFTNIQDAIKARKDGEEKYFAPIIEKYKAN